MRRLTLIIAGLAIASVSQAAFAGDHADDPLWVRDLRNSCWIYNPNPQAHLSVVWTGVCDANGEADGYGESTWFLYQNWVEVDAGTMNHGKVTGTWKSRFANGNYMVTNWIDGIRQPDEAPTQYSQSNPGYTPRNSGPTLGDRAMETLERQRRENCAAVAEGRMRGGCYGQ